MQIINLGLQEVQYLIKLMAKLRTKVQETTILGSKTKPSLDIKMCKNSRKSRKVKESLKGREKMRVNQIQNKRMENLIITHSRNRLFQIRKVLKQTSRLRRVNNQLELHQVFLKSQKSCLKLTDKKKVMVMKPKMQKWNQKWYKL
jgi:hypothetical protein